MTKTKKKKPALGLVYATKKGKRAAAFMPDEVIVMLDGSPTGQLLITCGWTLSTSTKDKACKRYPLARLQKNLGRIEEEWADEVGKGWAVEVRPV